MTLEEVQAELVKANERIATLETENATLSQNNEATQKELEKVRTINQEYYLKLTQAKAEPEDEPEPEAPTCEEFAKTLSI